MLLILEIITSEMPLKQRVQTPHSQDNWDTIYLVCLSPQALLLYCLFYLFIYFFHIWSVSMQAIGFLHPLRTWGLQNFFYIFRLIEFLNILYEASIIKKMQL